MLTIYGDMASGNCLKVKFTADRLGLAYDWESIDILKGESRTTDYLALSDMGQVPIIRLDDGRVLAQSNAIIRYLARGTVLLPEDGFIQAKIDELLFWEQNAHEIYVGVCRFQKLYLGEVPEAWRVARAENALDYLEDRLRGRDWLVGDAPSIADIALFPYSWMADEGGFNLIKRPPLISWFRRMERELALPPRSFNRSTH